MTARKLERGVELEIASDLPHKIPINPRSPSIPNLYEPPHDVVARLAFEIYENRPDYPGRDWEDWFEAETLLRLQAHVAQLSHQIQSVKPTPV